MAQTEAGKRLMRRTKADMIATIGQCLGILLAFFDLRQQYDYLKATFDILIRQIIQQSVKSPDRLTGAIPSLLCGNRFIDSIAGIVAAGTATKS